MTEPTGDAPTSTFLDSLGARGRRRAEPRMSIALAGAGCALAVLGVLIVAGDSGAGDDSFNRVPGIILTAMVVAGGLFTLHRIREGAIATAGAVAVVLGTPPLLFFLTFDEGGFPPYSTEAILVISTLVYAGTYAVGPGRGRPLFLGAALIGAWATLLQVTEKLFDAPYSLIGGLAFSFESSGFEDEADVAGPFTDLPDATTIGLLSLGVGVLYLFLSRRLDRDGYRGASLPFVAAALPALAVGILGLADELEAAGSGLFALLIGAGLAYHGSTVGRRGTTWIGGATAAFGLAVFIGDLTDDATIGGLLYVLAGVGLVVAAHVLADRLDEPDEMNDTALDGVWSTRLPPTPPGDTPPTAPV